MDAKIRQQLAGSIVWVISILFSVGCDNSGGSYDPYSSSSHGDPGGANSLYGVETVSPDLISTHDNTVTVSAVRSGLDVWKFLIDTSFSCYNHDALDYSEPYVTLTVSGTNFYSTRGNGTIDYDQSYGDFALIGGPFASDQSGYVIFNSYGQWFDIRTGSNQYSCFQHGAALEWGFHRFLLNTPALGDFTCTDVDSADQRILRLSPGGKYESTDGGGFYSYRGIIHSTYSEIDFSGGPLDGKSIFYSESPKTGEQYFRIRDTETFGIAIASSTSVSYVCTRFVQPRPFKKYGYFASNLPPAPTVPLNGLYFGSDIKSGDDAHYWADYYHFRPDGFMRLDHPSVGGDDCGRTRPNGLNYCNAYTVEDNYLNITYPSGRKTGFSIEFNASGAIAKISDETVYPITPIPTYASGVWSNLEFRESGCDGLGYCNQQSRTKTIRLEPNGEFFRSESGWGHATFDTALGVAATYAATQNDRSGSYEIHGNRLHLRYYDGSVGNQFIFITSFNRLVLNDHLYFDDLD